MLCMTSTSETPRSIELGVRLRDARTRAGLSQQKLADLLDRQHSHVSRWENGKLTLTEADAGAVLGILGITGAERDELLDLVRDAADPNWVAPGVDRQLQLLTEYERNATAIINVQPLLVPGLLQTVDYARAIMIGAGATRGEADQRATYRMGRREVLTRNRPVSYTALLGEHALRYPPCETSVAVEQLRQLVTFADMTNMTIQVMPFDRHYSPALEGPFVLIEGTKPVVHLEHYRSAVTLTDQRDVKDYQTAVDTLRRDAMSPEDSPRLIAEVADEMECTA